MSLSDIIPIFAGVALSAGWWSIRPNQGRTQPQRGAIAPAQGETLGLARPEQISPEWAALEQRTEFESLRNLAFSYLAPSGLVSKTIPETQGFTLG